MEIPRGCHRLSILLFLQACSRASGVASDTPHPSCGISLWEAICIKREIREGAQVLWKLEIMMVGWGERALLLVKGAEDGMGENRGSSHCCHGDRQIQLCGKHHSV